MARNRPFNPDALTPFATPAIRPALGVGGAHVWRYTVFVPTGEIARDHGFTLLADVEDIEALRAMLCSHLGGVSVLPPLLGYGTRETVTVHTPS